MFSAMTILTTSIFAQTDIFTRGQQIPVPKVDVGGFGNVIAGVDLDGDNKLEIYTVNDDWYDAAGTHELIPTIYKYEFNTTTFQYDSVWSTELDIPLQNTWPTMQWGDIDKDGRKEIIWCPVNNLSDANPNPSRIVVFEDDGNTGDNTMGVFDGTKYQPNAQWTILPASSVKEDMRPFRSKLADIDGDGTTEFIFSDRRNDLGFGVVSVSDVPDNGDGSETWTLEVNGKDSLNVFGVDTTAVLTGGSSWMDLAVLDNTIYLFNTSGDVLGVRFVGGNWEYLPVQKGLVTWSWKSAQVADIDGDGNKEIVVTNFSGGNGEVFLLQQDSDTLVVSQIADLSLLGGKRTVGSAQGDIDGDGNIDFVFGGRDSSPLTAVFRLEYQGGDITDPANWETSVIDNQVIKGARQNDMLAIANVDNSPTKEVIYTGIPRGLSQDGEKLPVTILNLMQFSGTVTPIADVRVDADSDFIPDNNGSAFSVIGVVNSVNYTASSNRFTYYVQDETGGIDITKGSETGGGTIYNVGDRLLVTGTVNNFRGTTELDIADLATDITFLDGGRLLTPKIMTLDAYLADAESYEGQLVTITGIAPTATSDAWPTSGNDANMTMWNGSPMTVTMRVDKDTDLPDSVAPSYPINVTGVATQFSFSTPPNDGYQVTPNFYSDIAQNVPAPPSPYFSMVEPADGAALALNDSSDTWTFSWNKPLDLNGDALIYELHIMFPDTTVKVGLTDTTYVLTAPTVLDILKGDTVSVDVQWTVITKGAEADLVASVDTSSFTLVNNVLVGVEDQSIPTKFFVDQNYPNPFNPTTTIKFGLPSDLNVDLRVYDILGQEVKVLMNNQLLRAGVHVVNFNASQLASGTYIYRLKAGNSVTIKKMMLLK